MERGIEDRNILDEFALEFCKIVERHEFSVERVDNQLLKLKDIKGKQAQRTLF